MLYPDTLFAQASPRAQSRDGAIHDSEFANVRFVVDDPGRRMRGDAGDV